MTPSEAAKYLLDWAGATKMAANEPDMYQKIREVDAYFNGIDRIRALEDKIIQLEVELGAAKRDE